MVITDAEIARRQAKAEQYHTLGFNCAQSVALATRGIADAANPEAGAAISDDTLFRLMEGFGGGMGGFRETCGAVTGGVAVAGLALSGGEAAHNTKAATYHAVREIPARFRDEVGTTLCDVIKGMRTADGEPLPRPYAQQMSCPACIALGVRITCEVLSETLPDTLQLTAQEQ